MSADTCPACGVSFQGEPIAPEHRTHKADHDEQVANYGRCYCFPYGDATHFRREIGIEVQGVYDGILYWVCPDCNHAWPRFTDGLGRLSRVAMEHVVAHNTTPSNRSAS